MYPNLQAYDRFALDTETTGLNHPVDKAFAFSIAVAPDEAYYYDIRTNPKALDWLKDSIRPGHTIICHNAAFDYSMLANAGFQLPLEQLDDTAIRACLINEHELSNFPFRIQQTRSYSLDALSRRYLKRGKLEIDIKDIANLPEREAADYAKEDAILTYLLWLWQEQVLVERDLTKIAKFERGVMPAIISAQHRGVRVDLDAAEGAMAGMTPIIEERQAKLNELVGWDVNVNSGPQMLKIFKPEGNEDDGYYVGDIRVGTTPKGKPSLKAEFLRELAAADPRADLVVKIRSDLKTRDTFLGKHILAHSYQGRVYPNINQVAGDDGGTKTGRLSYVDPALQQIPSRDKRVAAIVKPCFLPEEGHAWLSYDLASFEVRVFAALVGRYNDDILKKYRSNPHLDFHQYVADLTGLVRNAEYAGQANAKQLNLSMIFCQGQGATAAKMGLPTTDDEFEDEYGTRIKFKRAGPEAIRLIARYHHEVPGVKELASTAKQRILDRAKCQHKGEKWGWLQTSRGRRIRFPKGYKSYKGSGLLIQGTAADENKHNWQLLHKNLEEGHLILNTHDSYDLSVPLDRMDYYRDRIPEIIERELEGVPLLLDYNGYGPNWWSALNGV